MNEILNNDQFDRLLEVNPLVLAYFSGPNCGVCDSLQPKVEQLVREEFPQVKLVLAYFSGPNCGAGRTFSDVYSSGCDVFC